MRFKILSGFTYVPDKAFPFSFAFERMRETSLMPSALNQPDACRREINTLIWYFYWKWRCTWRLLSRTHGLATWLTQLTWTALKDKTTFISLSHSPSILSVPGHNIRTPGDSARTVSLCSPCMNRWPAWCWSPWGRCVAPSSRWRDWRRAPLPVSSVVHAPTHNQPRRPGGWITESK